MRAGTRCLLLDEPTAALERDATARLFDRVRQLTASGVAVLYISHHLEEVFEICQDVAVIRDGEMVLTAPTAAVTKEQLVAAMVGPDAPVPAAGLAARRPGPRRLVLRGGLATLVRLGTSSQGTSATVAQGRRPG